MDYPKNSGPKDGLGIPFIYDNPRLSLPSVRTKLLSKIGAKIYFLPDGPQLTDPKGEPMGGGKTSLTDPKPKLPGLQTGAVFSMKVRGKWVLLWWTAQMSSGQNLYPLACPCRK